MNPTYNLLATSVIGLAVAIIAFLQWRVAHAKLRLELFDRRYQVYDCARRFLGGIVSEGTFSDPQLFTYYAGISDAEFLFGSEIVNYLAQVKTRALDMRLKNKLSANSSGDERSSQIDDESKQLKWLSDQLTDITKVFIPYLAFSKVV